MKILIVHQYYLMPGQPGGSRFNEFARLWSEAGHDVTVICGTLDYASGQVPARYLGNWITEEQDGKVRVLRAYVPSSYSKNYLGRMWAFSGFTASALTAAVAKAGKADVVIATSPPLVAAVPGWMAAKKNGAPFIFEIRDLWPESAVTTGVLSERSPITRLLYRLEKWACAESDAVNVLTPAFRADLIRRGLASEDKIVFVPNGADVEAFVPGSRDNSVRAQRGWGDKFVVMYAGAHGRANALGQLLDAAALLKHRPDVLIALVGDGTERAKLEARVKAEGLPNVRVEGAVAKDQMPDFVRAADVGAAVLQDNPTFRTVYPNKVFDYMACERPTLLAIDGVARKLVCDDAQAGVFASPEHPKELASAIIRLADDPSLCAELGRRGRAYVLQNATREGLAKRYLQVMEDLVTGGRVVPLHPSVELKSDTPNPLHADSSQRTS